MRHALAAGLIGVAVVAGTEVPAYEKAPAYQPAYETPSAQRVNATQAVTLARAYLDQWERALAAIVAGERYTQTLTAWPRGRGVAMPRTETSRHLVSDVMLVRAPRGDEWLVFRDVTTVDDRPVHDRQRRFDELFVRPSVSLLADARRIADESARYNIGQLTRNINTPTMAFVFLDPRFATSTRWQGPRVTRLEDKAAWEVEFAQVRPPYAVRTPDGKPLSAKGCLWVEPGSGRILRSVVEIQANKVSLGLRNRRSRTEAQIDARFGPQQGLDVWVPLRMQDRYESFGEVNELVVGDAVYSNHRVFQTAARIVGPPF